jgi:myo-inositol 2-dehydrogenase/D-chiro-inositol 1-dehydrogenase
VIRVGFVGTGNSAGRHFSALSKLRAQAEVVAVCDVVEERGSAAAQRFGAQAYRSVPPMLAKEKLDARSVCVPPDAPVDQELTAIERGIHRFVAKPLPLDRAKATLIAQRARAAGSVTAVGFHGRSGEHVQVGRAALAQERPGLALGYFRNDRPDAPGWRIKARAGGQSVEQAIPRVDLLRSLGGEGAHVSAEDAERATADAPGHAPEDGYAVNRRFRDGAIGNLATCSILHRRFNVGRDLRCKQRADRVREDGSEVDGPSGIARIARSNDAGLAENVAFLQAIATGDRSGILSDYADAWRTQQVVLAANASAESGKPVALPEER